MSSAIPSSAPASSAEAAKAGKNAAAVATAEVDDRGEYRLGGLGPEPVVIAVVVSGSGAFVRVNIEGGGVVMMPSTNEFYYPDGATAANAQVLTLRPGEERPSLDFVIPAKQPGTDGAGSDFIAFGPNGAMLSPPPARSDAPPAPAPKGVIRGRVVSTDGRPIPRAQVRLLSMPSPGAATGAGVPRTIPTNTVVTVRRRRPVRVQRDRRRTLSDAGQQDRLFDARRTASARIVCEQRPAAPDRARRRRNDRTRRHHAGPMGLARRTCVRRAGRSAARRQRAADAGAVSGRPQASRWRGRPVTINRRSSDASALYGFPPGRYIVSATIGDVAYRRSARLHAFVLPGHARRLRGAVRVGRSSAGD